MRKIYNIEKFKQVNNTLHFILNENEVDLQFKPAKQVIVDSDDFAFIYLVDAGQDYSYLRFSPTIWPQLVSILKEQQNPILNWGEQFIVLEDFVDELQMLVFNIEGNNNYGEQFSKAVEEAFTLILKDNKV